MFERGFFKFGVWRGVPVRLHWTAPLGALIFGGLRVAPAVWFAFFALVVIHELGHAWLVRRYGHHVMAIDVTGFGGLCRWVGSATTYERAAIAWGGVAAQAVLLVAASAIYELLGPPRTVIGSQLVSGFIFANFWLIALNLLPFPPFDGAEAWPLARMWISRLWGDLREPRSEPPPSLRSSRVSSSSVRPPPVEPVTEEELAVAPAPSREHGSFAEFLKRVAAAAHEARRGSPSARRSR